MGNAFIIEDDANHNEAARAQQLMDDKLAKAAADKVAQERAAAAANAGKKFYFKCLGNPRAPLLVLDTYWEAKEMRSNPEYIRVDSEGNAWPDEETDAPTQIPVGPALVEQKRKTLTLNKGARK
jgi:hypothetical protein